MLLCPPYSAISVELYYIFATVWGREAYTLYGILFLVFVILISVTACISVALTYHQLSSEDYRWWWKSIFSSGLVGIKSCMPYVCNVSRDMLHTIPLPLQVNWFVCVCLLVVLLLQAFPHVWLPTDGRVFWLHHPRVLHLLPDDGYRLFLYVTEVCQIHLPEHQDGLIYIPTTYQPCILL